MIRLLEWEGKQLLKKRGFQIPDGGLLPEWSPSSEGPWVVKAQALTGGRGKAGGIKIAQTLDEISSLGRTIMGMTINGAAVRSVYVEEKIDVAQEMYLAAHVDRDAGTPVLMVSRRGGVDIESVSPSEITRYKIDPLLGLQEFAIGALARSLKLEAPLEDVMRKMIADVYRTLIEEDAELVEINPLIIDTKGRVLAADAKVILDEDSAFRHPGRKAIPDGTPFEEEARTLEVMGIEMDPKGDIAAIMNGAGMTMATLDQLVAWGGTVRALIELHGALRLGPDHITKVVNLMLGLRPKVLFINIYYQFLSLETISKGVAKSLQSAAGDLPPIVIRMRGVSEDLAKGILQDHDCFFTNDFSLACKKIIEFTQTRSRL